VSPHPDLETLAEAAEGLLEPSENERVMRHAHGCAECAHQLQSLADVSATLAALPAPAMPADVAARLDEVLRSLTSAEVAPVVDLSPRRRLSPRVVLGSAAACLVLLVGVAFAAGVLRPDGKHATQSATPAGGTDLAAPILTTGRDYTTAALASQVDALLRQANNAEGAKDSARLPQPGGVLGALPSTMMTTESSPDLFQTCSTAIDPNVRPLAIDIAEFEGIPAAVVVIPSDRPGNVEVWITDPTCTPGLVRFFTRVEVG
jgi:hypothetical protein